MLKEGRSRKTSNNAEVDVDYLENHVTWTPEELEQLDKDIERLYQEALREIEEEEEKSKG